MVWNVYEGEYPAGCRVCLGVTHSALVWLLPSVPAHVNHQHVLSLEGLLLPRALAPAAHKLLLLSVDVVVIDVLQTQTHTHTYGEGSLPLELTNPIGFINTVLYHGYLSLASESYLT